MYKAVIFDLDGTLLDTIDDLADSMNAVLAELGCPAHSVEQYKFLVGDGMDVLVWRSLPPDRRDDETCRRTYAMMKAQYARWQARKTRPYAGIAELLTALRARGLAIAVLSNKPDDATVEVMASYFPQVRFDVVRGAREDVPKKPDPAAALEIAAQLSVQPAEVLYVGDTNTDMKTARAAGMKAVGALWGFRPRQELIDNGAQALITYPLELLALLTNPEQPRQ